MKTLLLMRHAKSDWSKEDVHDHDRVLNERGKRDAPRMGDYLASKNIEIDLFLSSTAKRATQTSLEVAKKLHIAESEITFLPKLYNFSCIPYIEILKTLTSQKTVLLVAHNPSIEELIYLLTYSPTSKMIEVPTATIAKIDLSISNWVELDKGVGKLDWIMSPKKLS